MEFYNDKKYEGILKEMQANNKLLKENNQLLALLVKHMDEVADQVAKVRGFPRKVVTSDELGNP